ncbi:MAG: hypothetical protein NZ750_07870 [Anaerolineae bacterium]|nr:hypothetical protein [Anaerolineae bacterium]MDW8172267.1 hypothetical protein [Anaerolineae bacterium]
MLTIQGISLLEEVSSSTTYLPVIIHWQILHEPDRSTQAVQFSLRLVDQEGTKRSQFDVNSLDYSAWRVRDTVVTYLELPIDEETVSDFDDLRFELVAYTYPDMSSSSPMTLVPNHRN